MRHFRGPWTRERVAELGMTCGIETAAQIIGIGRTVAYRLAREGEWPTPIRKLGGRYLVTVQGLLDFLDETERGGRA
jgi:predicted site-specific integrase-resolvase